MDNLENIYNEEFEKCKNDIVYFSNKYCNFSKGLFETPLYPYQENVLKLVENHKFLIFNISRNIGFSTLEAVYILWLLIFKRDVNIAKFSINGSQLDEFFNKIYDINDSLPQFLRLKFKNNNKRVKEFTNGNFLKLFTLSTNPLCSLNPTHIFLSDAAYYINIKDFLYAILATSSNIFISSQPNGDNYFKTLCDKAEIGENGFLPFKLKWDVHPNKDLIWKYKEMERLGKVLFSHLYECEFVN